MLLGENTKSLVLLDVVIDAGGTKTKTMRLHSDFVKEMDFEVGRIIDSIDQAGIGDQTTIIIFTSDNGCTSVVLGTESDLDPESEIIKEIDYGGKQHSGTYLNMAKCASWRLQGTTPVPICVAIRLMPGTAAIADLSLCDG
jgi:arylsulfatase A-like enzyme